MTRSQHTKLPFGISCRKIRSHTCMYAVALAERDGDDIMVDVYESIHDELRAKKRALEREKEKVSAHMELIVTHICVTTDCAWQLRDEGISWYSVI